MGKNYMHLFRKITFAAVLFFVSFITFAQSTPAKPVKVAVLVPLYLDSAFAGSVYKLGNNSLPKYILPGLDFYNGVMMAIDSLQQEGQQLEVMIHDTKSAEKPLSLLLVEPELATASFIIASFTANDELKKVAEFARTKNIPLISATYPNHGGITNNPNLVIINPTLATHIDGIFKYVQRNHSMDNVILLKRKSDAMDRYIMESIIESSSRTYSAIPLRIKYVEVSDVFNTKEVIDELDSTKYNVVIGATLNEPFAANIVKTLSSVRATYESSAIGMPTWDNIKELSRAEAKGIPIIYSTAYNFQKSDRFLSRLAANYKNTFNGRASDMVFKGYEAMYHFTKLYLKHGSAFMSNLSDNDFRITNEFDIQPVKQRKENVSVDYLENKKLYYISKMDGVMRAVR